MTEPVTREAVMVALLELLSSAGPFNTVGRRNRSPDTIAAAGTPALMLVEHSEHYRVTTTLQPPIRKLIVKAIVYCDVGKDENAIPATIVNNLLDAIDRLLPAPTPLSGPCTLGGLVRSVVIDGAVIKAPGDVTGKSLAMVPLTILLP